MLSPETLNLIEALASDMRGLFTPPELYVGCEVLDVSEKDSEATDNGWIEARVAQHNRQRCRWLGNYPNPQVGDFIDVFFFPTWQLFKIWGKTGTGALSATWGAAPPYGKIRLLKTDGSTVEYSDFSFAIAAASSGELIWLGPGTYECENETLPSGVDLRGMGKDVSVLEADASTTTLTIAGGGSVVENLTVQNVRDVASTVGSVLVTGDCTLFNIKFSTNNPNGSGLANNFQITSSGTQGGIGCEFTASAGSGTPIAFQIASAATFDLHSAKIDGTISLTSASAVLNLNGAIELTSGNSISISAGTVNGYYIQDGELYAVDDSGYNAGVWLIDESAGLQLKKADISTALTDSATDDAIRAEADTYDEQIVTTAKIHLWGDGISKTIIQKNNVETLFQVGSDFHGSEFKVENIRAGATAQNARTAYLVGNDIVMERVHAHANMPDATAGSSWGFYTQGTGIRLLNCEADADNSSTTRQALYVASGDVTVIGGRYNGGSSGSDADIHVASGTAHLEGPTLENGTISGDWDGWYYDGSNNKIVIGGGNGNSLDVAPFVPIAPSDDLIPFFNVDESDFRATIDSLPGGAAVRYDTPSSGTEGAIEDSASNNIAKIRLYNETRSNYAIISSVDTTGGAGYDGEITVTDSADISDWQAGDTITCRSQTNTDVIGGSAYFFDFEIDETTYVPQDATAILIYASVRDTGSVGQVAVFHPWESGVASKRRPISGLDTSASAEGDLITMPLISRRFTLCVRASGSGTAKAFCRLSGYWTTAP